MKTVLSRLDVGRIALSVLTALVLYRAVSTDENPPVTGNFDVAVEIMNVPPSLVLLSEQQTSIQVQVSAPREEWAGLRPSSFRAVADLSGATLAVQEYPVRIEAPAPSVQVLAVIPPRIPVRLDATTTRTIPVRLTRVGDVPFGYGAGDAEIDPATVSVTGPASVVGRMEAVTVEVRLNNATADVQGPFTPSPVDAQSQPIPTSGPSLQFSPAVVQVHIPVTQQISYKTVSVQPNIIGTVPSELMVQGISVEPPTVIVAGPQSALATVNFASTETIDLTDANSTFVRQVTLVVPSNVTIPQQDTVSVTVRVGPLVLPPSSSPTPTPASFSPTPLPASPTAPPTLGPASATRSVTATRQPTGTSTPRAPSVEPTVVPTLLPTVPTVVSTASPSPPTLTPAGPSEQATQTVTASTSPTLTPAPVPTA